MSVLYNMDLSTLLEFVLSHDIMPVSDITPCIKMDKSLVVYIIIPPANFVCDGYLYPPQTLFVVGILFSRPSVRPCVRPSVTFCFLNILKSHCWIFIKPCKHVHICKTNTLDKKVRARGQFY